MSTKTAKAADEFNDSLAALSAATGALGKNIGKDLLGPLTDLIKFLTSAVGPIFGALKAIFLDVAGAATALAAGFAAIWFGVTKTTDALHITTNASQSAKETMDALVMSAKDLRSRAQETFNTMVMGYKDLTAATDESTKAKTKENHVTNQGVSAGMNKKATDKEIADALKKHLEDQQKGEEKLKRQLDAVLDTKRATKTFDDEYFEARKVQLILEGKSVEQVTKIITAERQKQLDDGLNKAKEQERKGTEIAGKGLKEWLDIRKQYGKVDEEYFRQYKRLLEMQGLSTTEIQEKIAEEAIKTGLKIGKANQDAAEAARKAAEESAAEWKRWFSITGMGTAAEYVTAFKDFAVEAFGHIKRGLGDAVADMIVEGGSFKDKLEALWGDIKKAFISMLVEMGVEEAAKYALRLAGWTATEQSRVAINKAANAQIAASDAITSGSGIPMGSMVNIPGEGAGGAGAGSAPGAGAAMSTGASIATAIATILGLTELNQMEGGFWSPDVGEELEQQWGFGKGSRDKKGRDRTENRVNLLLSELPNAPSVEALDTLERLIQEGGSNSWLWHDVSVDLGADAAKNILKILDQSEAILSKRGMLKGEPDWANMVLSFDAARIADWNFQHDLAAMPQLAMGGIATGPTIAMIGEAGPEAVVPLSSQMLGRIMGGGGAMGGGGGDVNISIDNIVLPNVNSIKDLDRSDWERALKGELGRAAENLRRYGHKWPMESA